MTTLDYSNLINVEIDDARRLRAERNRAASRLDDAERRLDIARRALDDAIQRAAARGDRDEVEVLHRDRRLLGGG